MGNLGIWAKLKAYSALPCPEIEAPQALHEALHGVRRQRGNDRPVAAQVEIEKAKRESGSSHFGLKR
jgi:hypothetical protein